MDLEGSVTVRLFTVLACSLMISACGDPRDDRLQSKRDATDEHLIAVDVEADWEEDNRPYVPILTGDGIELKGQMDRYPTAALQFSVRRKPLERAFERLVGPFDASWTSTKCETEVTQFSRYGELVLNYSGDKFVGWTLKLPSSIATLRGVRLGMDRNEIEAIRKASEEAGYLVAGQFLSHGVQGTFDDKGGKLSRLYAGTQCSTA